ncbi:A24 family peptidase [Pseudarthrobacter sp. NamB4]|uniref:prepilin peptidase n=1 Tax=Pseudarthrobacter sp. NamB4 TaxID=2576837 RepID=UPI0010FE4230|nr:A24 family peptidase [Pseudarthrobacter sp. NamB4]TLM74710.1 prepilin peptidase [Pseudarthrobacter sp. NamB4]
MTLVGTTLGPVLVPAIATAFLGALLSAAAELLIFRFLPRLGQLPAPRVRITTAAVTAALCAALTLRIGVDWALPAFLVLGVFAVQLACIDLTSHLLPNPLVLGLLTAGVALLALSSYASADFAALLRAIAGAAVLFVVYLALALVSPSGIGMGDVKLAAPVGLYLGYLGWSEIFYGGALGFVLSGILSAILVASKRRTSKAEVAFAPSMLAALVGTILAAY